TNKCDATFKFGEAGVVRLTSNNRSWNKPPRLRSLRWLRDIFLMGASSPPLPRRGIRFSSRSSLCPRPPFSLSSFLCPTRYLWVLIRSKDGEFSLICHFKGRRK